MRSAAFFLVTLFVLCSPAIVQLGAQAPGDPGAYLVTYVDVMPSGRSTMASAFKQYRDASRTEDGFVRAELREQSGWPGHYAVVEAWRDQKAVDAHAAAPHVKQYQDALQAIRVSGYDQRLHKPLTVAPGREASGRAVYVIAHLDIAGGGTVPPFDAPGVLRKLAEASRAEPGCLRFEVFQHITRANHFTIVEAWQDEKAHDAHAAAAHTKAYRDTVQPVTGSPLDERLYKGVE